MDIRRNLRLYSALYKRDQSAHKLMLLLSFMAVNFEKISTGIGADHDTGNILMLSEGQSGVDNVFTLRNGKYPLSED